MRTSASSCRPGRLLRWSGLVAIGTAAVAAAGPLQSSAPTATAAWVDPARLTIDGDRSEWAAGPAQVVIDRPEQFVELVGRGGAELWSGPEDCAVELWLGWNDSDWLVAGRVRDQAADHDEARWYHGDSLELFLNTVDAQPRWGRDDWQLMLAPNWGQRPSAPGGSTPARARSRGSR